jgi:hypothetical protein
LNSLEEDGGQITSKGDEGRSHPVEVKFTRKNLRLFHRSCPGETSGQNSLWRIREVERTIGSLRSCGEVKHWIEQRCISLQPYGKCHFGILGILTTWS